MKRNIFYTALLVGALMVAIGCKGNRNSTTETETTSATETTTNGTTTSTNTGAEQPGQPIDGHNAKNSLDYMGTYRKALSAPEVGDILLDLTLTEETYTLELKLPGVAIDESQKPITDTYTWDSAGRTITLKFESSSSPLSAVLPTTGLHLMVAENALHFLDKDGNRFTGEEADKYTLTKISD